MKAEKHIERIIGIVRMLEDALYDMNNDGHTKLPDEWVVMGDLQKNTHKMRQVFEKSLNGHKNNHKSKNDTNQTAGEVLNSEE